MAALLGSRVKDCCGGPGEGDRAVDEPVSVLDVVCRADQHDVVGAAAAVDVVAVRSVAEDAGAPVVDGELLGCGEHLG